MRTVIIIPARYGSQRLPGKPLLNATGKYLIEHVYERARQARSADCVIVATDDQRVAGAVASFGGRVALTRDDHPSGTDRVAEVARQLDAEVIVNLQGDEPLVQPESIDLLVGLVEADSSADMATLAAPLAGEADWRSPHCVKVVCDHEGAALYFSRSPIPFVREGGMRPGPFLQHVGIYAYRRDFLLQLAATPPCELEQLEKLEQLRALWLGRRIRVGRIKHAARGVDTPEDYQAFVEEYRRGQREAA